MTTGTTTDWDAAISSGLLRIAAGAALLRFRGTAIRWSGGDPDDSALRALFTYWGFRDLAVGVTTLASTRPGRDVSRAVVLQAAADASDGVLVATAVSHGHLPRTRGLGLIGLCWGTAAADVAVAWRLRRGL